MGDGEQSGGGWGVYDEVIAYNGFLPRGHSN